MGCLHSWPMPLCFIEPQDAIRVIAESVGREARRQLLGGGRAGVGRRDPRAPSWRPTTPRRSPTSTSTTCRCSPPGTRRSRSGTPVPNKEFLVGVFPQPRREPPRGAEDRRRLPRRGRVRAGRGRGAGAGHRAAVAVPGAVRRARGGVPGALHAGTASAATTDLAARSPRCSARSEAFASRPSLASRPPPIADRERHHSSLTSSSVIALPEPVRRRGAAKTNELKAPRAGRGPAAPHPSGNNTAPVSAASAATVSAVST